MTLMLISRLDVAQSENSARADRSLPSGTRLVNELKPRTAHQKILLNLKTPNELPPIAATQGHIRVVFYNLLDNALKYTPEGARYIGGCGQKITGCGQSFQRTMAGVSPLKTCRVFERFYRADKAHLEPLAVLAWGWR